MIRLSWNPVSGATSYELQFAEGSYTSADTTGELGNAGVSVTTISSGEQLTAITFTPAVKTGTQYSYRLRALGANDVKSSLDNQCCTAVHQAGPAAAFCRGADSQHHQAEVGSSALHRLHHWRSLKGGKQLPD